MLNGNRLEWTPTLEQVNDWFRFTVTVSDGTGASTKQDWRVDVVPGSEPPVITSEPPATATVGVPYVYELAVTDPEGDPLTYELNDRYNAGAVLNGNRLEWTPTPGQANDLACGRCPRTLAARQRRPQAHWGPAIQPKGAT